MFIGMCTSHEGGEHVRETDDGGAGLHEGFTPSLERRPTRGATRLRGFDEEAANVARPQQRKMEAAFQLGQLHTRKRERSTFASRPVVASENQGPLVPLLSEGSSIVNDEAGDTHVLAEKQDCRDDERGQR